jgi:hypothetical protein
MNRITRRNRIVPCVVACCVLTACGRDEPAVHATAAEIDAPDITGGTDTVYTAAPTREDLPSARIYFTLTDHEWYARGLPLVHENTPYIAGGRPVSASLDQMEHMGDYDGVEYYARHGDERRTLYVPVFEGYWQPFHPDTTVRSAS